MRLKLKDDAYGQAMWDFFHGKETEEIIEREDGYIDVGRLGHQLYFAPFRKWLKIERQAIRFAQGRVLDVGCGPGRVALYLQEKGHEAVGIDYSPLAIRTARARGVKEARVMAFKEVSGALGRFDTVVMFGNNFGLFESFRTAQTMLKRLYRMTSAQGRIIATIGDPYKTKEPIHRWYHKYNRARGRMGGQIRIRVRYRKMITPWFDYLFASQKELLEILEGTGWRVHRIFDEHPYIYTAVLAKTD